MKKLAIVFSFWAIAGFAAEWTGYVSCSKCGAKHRDGSQASSDCVKSCIKGGAQVVLVVGNKTFAITNGAKVPERLYGLKVDVKGTLKGDAVEIDAITPIE